MANYCFQENLWHEEEKAILRCNVLFSQIEVKLELMLEEARKDEG